MKRLIPATERVAAVFLLLISLLTAGNVIMRNVFDQTLLDWFDFSRLLLGIAMFWGIAVATYRAGHICVDVIWEVLNEKNRQRMDVAASILTFAFLAPLAWMAWVKVFATGAQATSDLRLPLIWFFAVAAAGAVMAAILAGIRVIEVLRGQAPRGSFEEVENGS